MDMQSGSPDFNPIEHMWNELRVSISARQQQSRPNQELGAMFVEEWTAIPFRMIRVSGFKQLETDQQKLNLLLKKLFNAPDVQTKIEKLASEWMNVREELSIMLFIKWRAVKRRKSKLLSKRRPNANTFDKFKAAMIEFRKDLTKWADDVRRSQTNNHDVVEICRQKKKEDETKRQLIGVDISQTMGTINSLRLEIEACYNDANSKESDARQLKRNAEESHEMSTKHAMVATVGSGIGLLTGLALAPFTGGSSIAFALGAAGANTVVHGTAACLHESSANSSEISAKRKHEQARDLRMQIGEHESDIYRKEWEVTELKNREDDLEETISIIRDVESIFYKFIDYIEERLINIQNVETVLREIELNGNMLSIILCAWERDRKKGFFRKLFGWKPKYLNEEEEDLKLKIKEKWEIVERSMLPSVEMQSVPGAIHLQLM
ncbi:uncharacterized protein LOC132715724 [Ruditapes philippinarum]|uniref:uncharacterized protein LOC132715724 n=1 Tax=Ruditapes philippinarum TaxID=129788 RepID=UPI00295B68DA|nr:uncharacterized protein LOC132715724 [Ruditapes philippinarum]